MSSSVQPTYLTQRRVLQIPTRLSTGYSLAISLASCASCSSAVAHLPSNRALRIPKPTRILKPGEGINLDRSYSTSGEYTMWVPAECRTGTISDVYFNKTHSPWRQGELLVDSAPSQRADGDESQRLDLLTSTNAPTALCRPPARTDGLAAFPERLEITAECINLDSAHGEGQKTSFAAPCISRCCRS
eukprot:1337564-Pleurochrysis_carterae.AAC.1